MNPSDYELYDTPSSGSVKTVYTCRACDGRFCSCTALEVSGPFGCPCGECAEWRPLGSR